MFRVTIYCFALLCLSFSVLAAEEKKEEKETGEYAWKPMFDGKTLDGWTVPQFGGDGEVRVKDGSIVIGQGAMMTGIKYEKLFPTLDYEIQYEARRTQGTDFFAALTFPYRENFCTFINGGWGGSTVGLSCIDGMDASENQTGNFHSFRDNEWYLFRIIVMGAKIQVFVVEETKEKKKKEENLVDWEIGDKKLSLREETSLYKPLGICTWVSEGQLRNIKYRKLKPEEIDGKK